MIYEILQKIFPQVDLNNKNEKGYVSVCCPFHDDNKASAFINPVDGFFECFACGIYLQFEQFINKKFGTTGKNLYKALSNTVAADDVDTLHKKLLSNPVKLMQLQSLGISLDTIQECRLVDNNQNYLVNLPILVDNVLLGYRYYTPNAERKAYPTTGMPNGLIAPFDVWKLDTRPTLICEGEKDMLVARSNGFNAITLTGGCMAMPYGFENFFKDRLVAICYDNDEAGKTAAAKLADHLFKYGAQVKVVSNYYEVIRNKGQDITDFFMTYNMSAQALANYINATPLWTLEDSKKLKDKETPPIVLDKCLDEKNLNKKLQSLIQVKAEDQEPKSIPKTIEFVYDIGNDQIKVLYETQLKDCYGILQSPTAADSYIKQLSNEVAYHNGLYNKGYSKVKYKYCNPSKESKTVYSCIVSPYVESEVAANNQLSINETLELVAYSFTRLASSKIYNIYYEAVPNVYKKRAINLLVHDKDDALNSVSSFKITDYTKKAIDAFKPDRTIKEKIWDLYYAMKHHPKYGIAHLNFNLWLANELTFNSCLWFKLNNRLTRGTIYLNVIGDTRTGKSEIAERLIELYKQGKKVNAKLSTIDSIIGGTAEKGGEKFIKAGSLPRNNRSLVVLEELHGLGNDYFKKITEVKSSGKVSIQRVSGELSLECNVRLIEISNPKASNAQAQRSVVEFPNGVDVIRSLINAPEDIARNDIYVIMKKTDYINPYSQQPMQVLPDDYYAEKIKWVWSRGTDNFIFENPNYIWQQAQEKLNSKFDCDGLSILGAEAHIKVARMSIALACILGSTLDYVNVYVKNEHVDFIISWLSQLYSDETMRIDQYVIEEKAYSSCDDTDIQNLHSIYLEWPTAINFLENQTEVNKDLLIQISGKKPNETGPLFADLTIGKFIRTYGSMVVPTAKFRKAIKCFSKQEVKFTL